MPTSFSDLPDDVLHRILLMAYRNQIVISTGCRVAYSQPPCLRVSKQVAKVAKLIPIRLLRVVLGYRDETKTVRLLRSIRCPVQILDFSEVLPGGVGDWTSMLDFVTQCAHPEQVQTVRMIHSSKRGCPRSSNCSCSHLQDIISKVKERMPQCELVVSSYRD